jgi:hypothetical protein
MVRTSLFQLPRFGLFLGFGAGFATDRASAVGLPAGAPRPFVCSGAGPAGLALRAGIGTEVQLGPRVFFLTDFSATTEQLSGDYINNCAPGVGTLNLLGLRAGVVYRFEISRYVR